MRTESLVFCFLFAGVACGGTTRARPATADPATPTSKKAEAASTTRSAPPASPYAVDCVAGEARSTHPAEGTESATEKPKAGQLVVEVHAARWSGGAFRYVDYIAVSEQEAAKVEVPTKVVFKRHHHGAWHLVADESGCPNMLSFDD